LEYSEAVYQLFVGFEKAYDSVRVEVLYNLIFELGIPMKLLRLIKICLNENCSRVRVSKHSSDVFPVRNDLKQGDVLSSLLFNLAVEHAIKKVQINQNGLKLNCTYQLLVYAYDVNILGDSVHATKENTEALVVVSKEIGLDLNADKTKYMAMS
jgi:hypothetical protein